MAREYLERSPADAVTPEMLNERMTNLHNHRGTGHMQAEAFAIHWNNLRRGFTQQEIDND